MLRKKEAQYLQKGDKIKLHLNYCTVKRGIVFSNQPKEGNPESRSIHVFLYDDYEVTCITPKKDDLFYIEETPTLSVERTESRYNVVCQWNDTEEAYNELKTLASVTIFDGNENFSKKCAEIICAFLQTELNNM